MAQLQLMRDGFTGRLAELSRFLGDDSGWITLKGKGWEEMPYWLKGYGDLAYLLKDAAMRKETERWLGQAFKSQDRDGYFGPGRQPGRARPLAEHGHAGGHAELSTRPPATAACSAS
ncbi:MAG: glycoside hydrolase family 127 protein [Candidatus Moduliflexus flocculans]|nr:glycoside hydrolase family 127 protein [Candidatus Moduliflexus flocculans]